MITIFLAGILVTLAVHDKARGTQIDERRYERETKKTK